MCWRGSLKDRKVASKDIHCKKILAYTPLDPSGMIYSGYFRTSHKYELYNTYHATIHPWQTESMKDRCLVDEGIHCYSNDVKITQTEQGLLVGINKYGFTWNGHKGVLYPTSMNATETSNCELVPVVVECTIPKGTTYYQNHYGEIVAEALYIGDVIMMYQYGKKD